MSAFYYPGNNYEIKKGAIWFITIIIIIIITFIFVNINATIPYSNRHKVTVLQLMFVQKKMKNKIKGLRGGGEEADNGKNICKNHGVLLCSLSSVSRKSWERNLNVSFLWYIIECKKRCLLLETRPTPISCMQDKNDWTDPTPYFIFLSKIRLKPDPNQNQTRLKPDSNQTQTRLKPDSNQN